MEVIDIQNNILSLDLSEEERDILFRAGLQIWIDNKIGKNKVKVLPVDSSIKIGEIKQLTEEEIKEEKEFTDELIGLAVNEALRIGIENSEGKRG